jgi:hypothetical protein
MPMNLNIDPYYDDYDHKKGFHKILFKPGVAVQARELTQIQSILQNQVTKFADHIFEDGSVVDGAAHTIDFNVTYFKISDSFNSAAIVFDDTLVGKTIVVNSEDVLKPDNRKFLIKAVTQKTGTDPKTIYATFLSGGSTGSSSKYVSTGVRLDVYSVPNPVIGTTSIFRSFSTEATGDNVSGNSVLFGIDEGIFYTKNSFVYCPTQTIVVSKYANLPYTGTITAITSSASITGVGTLFTTELAIGDDIFTSDNKLIGTVLSIADNTHLTLKNNANTLVTDATSYTVPLSKVIGLKAVESIITSDTDSTLLDPSFGSYNYAAPGADRYFISLEASAVSYQEQSLSSEDFIDICHIKNGVVESDQRLPIYSNLEDIFARRTYDESGDYIVNGLLPTVKANPDDTLLTLNVAPGKAYVKGYEIEKNGVTSIELTKPRTFASTLDYTVATQYGNYITVSEITGNLPDITSSSSINFYSSSDVVIGTARVINLLPVSYGEYQLYLDDVVLTAESFASVVSIGEISGEFTATLISSKISDTSNRLLVFPIPLGNIKTVSTASYESKRLFKSVPVYGGVCSLTSDSLTKDFVPSSGSFNNINYTISLLTLSSGTGYTVDTILDLSTADITVSTNPLTNSSVSFDFNDSSFNGTVDIIATVNITGQATRTKTLVVNYGKTVSFAANSAVKQSLGVSDIHKFTGAYVVASKTYAGTYDPLVTYASNSVVMRNGKLYDITGTTLGTTAYENIASKFQIDNGQTDSYYGNGSISRTSVFTVATTVLVVFDYYLHSGEGPLVVNNAIGVSYSDIGDYYDSVSFSTYKLRNCLDFRPVQQEDAAGFDTFTLPYSNAILDVDYYLGRIDKLSLDKTGKYQVIQGIPARQPTNPASNPDAMDICSITYDAYTDDEKSTKLSLVKNKRYTMKDIGALEGRIENVEYYTSLSMLEKDTSSKTFTDDNGTPLFNNGFLVDSFQGKNVADVTNPDMQTEIDYDKNELRPKFYTKTAHANLATTGTGINSNTITLPYTSTKLTGVDSYSTTVSVNPYNVVTVSGSAALVPDTDHWVKELLPVNDADTIKQLAGTSDLVPVTVWNAWDPKSGATLSTSAITSADADFIDIATSKNKVVSGTTYNFTKNVIPVTRERVIQYKVTNMLANTNLYYFFGKELQEDGFVTNATGSVFLTTPPATDDSGNATGYIVIPEGKEGSTFVITFSNSPAGKEYASSYVSVNYYVDMSAKYADEKPITVVTGDQVGTATVTELKVPKPTSTYTIEPSSYVVSEAEIFTFTFNAVNYDLKGDFTGTVVVTDGTATFDSKTVNGTAITSLASFTFAVDSAGKAVIKLKVTDDGVSQAARKITLTVTPHNKSSRDITKYPEFLYGTSLSSTIKLLNPVKTEYSVTGPISVGTTDTVNVTFQSTNAEADIPISYKVYKKIGSAAEVDITSSFSTANPFNTSNASSSHVLTRNVSSDDVSGQTVYKDKNGQYRYVFTDASGNSKEHIVRIIGIFDTKYYKLSNNAYSSNVAQGSRITFALETNHYTTNASSDTIPFIITANDVDVTTLTGYTVSPAITSFTGTALVVSVTVSNSLVLTAPKTLKLELTGTNKGKGTNSICYIQNNAETSTLTADKSANASIADSETINFTVTSSYGSAAAGTKVTGIKVSNLASNEYTLNATSGVLNSSGVFTFSLTAVALRTATLDKTFNVTMLYNDKDTLTSSTYNLSKSVQPTLSTKFRNSTNTADLTTINPTSTSGTASSAKLLITQTALPTTENVTITITPSPMPTSGYVFSGNTNTFSQTMTVAALTAASNLVDVGFTLAVPSNITLKAEVKSAVRGGLSGTSTLYLNNSARAFTIAKDSATIAAGATKNYTVTIANENTSRNVTWSIAFADASDISTYFSTYSGSGTISVGGSLTAAITRNSVGYPTNKAIVLTVVDAGGVVPTGTNSEMTMVSVATPLPVIKFYDVSGSEITSFLTLLDSANPYMVKADIYSGDFTSEDLVSYTIQTGTKSLDLFTSTTGSAVYSIPVTDNKVDSNKIASTTFWIKKNTSTVQAGNAISLTLSSAKVSGVIKQLTTKQTLTVKTKSIVSDALSIYRNGYAGESAFSITIGGDYDIFVNKTAVINTSTDKVYFVINPLAGNTTALTASNFTITPNGGSAATVISSHTTTNAALNAVIPTTGLLYDVTTYANDLVKFKVNTGSITANDKVSLTCYIIRANDLGYLASSLVTSTIAAAPVKAYKPSLPMTIYNGGSVTMEYSPENFAGGDTHTLTLPLHGLTLASDINVWVNGTAVTAINGSGVITPSVTLTGNNKVTVKVTSKSDTVGQIESKIVNVADSTIKSSTYIDTNKGIIISADKDVNEAQQWEVSVTPRLTDTTYQVGVFDYSSGSYVGIQGSAGVHISYTDLNGTTIVEDLTSRLITFNSSNLAMPGNVAKFKYYIPVGFNSSATVPKQCRIKFVGSDGSVAFFPINVSQNAGLKKTFVITNDSSSANNAKKEGEIVTFTITPKNASVTDLYNFTLATKNGRKFSLIEESGDGVTTTISPVATTTVYARNLLTENKVKFKLDDNLIVDQSTEILLTVYPKDTAYTTNGSVVTSSAFVVNSSTPNQTINFFDMNGTPITQVKNNEYFVVEGYNNVLPSALNFSADLVEYIEPLVSDITNVSKAVSGIITYDSNSTSHYKFKFRALPNKLNLDMIAQAMFFLNRPAAATTSLNAFLNILEEKSDGTINVTTKDNLLYATSKLITFNVDTTGFNSKTPLNWTLTPPTGVTVKNVTFVDLNSPIVNGSRKKWIEGTDTSDGLTVYGTGTWNNVDNAGKVIPNSTFIIKYDINLRTYVSNFQEAKDYIDKLNNQQLDSSYWYNDWIIPGKNIMQAFSGFTKLDKNKFPIILENIPFFWYFDDAGIYYEYKQGGQPSPSYMGSGPTVSVIPIRKVYI